MVRLLLATVTAEASRGSGLMVRRRLQPHFSATVRQSEGSASMVQLLPATEEASRGSAPADTLGGTTRPKSVYSSLWTFWTYGVNDNTLFEAGDGGGERRCPHHGDVTPPPTSKKTLGSARSRAGSQNLNFQDHFLIIE
jgi:hypothetical protein